MHLADRALDLLDHRLLTRVGNLRTLISIAGLLGLLAVAVVLAIIKLYANVGWVPLLFLGLALAIALALALGRLWRGRSPEPAACVDVPKGRSPIRTTPGAGDGTTASQLGELLREQMDDIAGAAVAKARSSPGQVQKGGAGSTNLQAGGDIRIDGRHWRRG
ncbi:MAG: hypothetical protein ACLP01_11555 [Solirubrobacteraceae bacterium]